MAQFPLPILPQIPAPPGSDLSPAVARWIQEIIRLQFRDLASRVENLITVDTIANQPAADGTFRFFYATDTNTLYFDDGTWNAV